eukprot:scaffold8505_cov130-Cylindrotheca_fusiformis.AAC.3
MNHNPGDILHLQVSKSDRKAEAGLKLEEDYDGRIYIRKVTGLIKRRGLPVEAGDELITLNGMDVEDYASLDAMKRVLKTEVRISFSIRKADVDESENSYEDPYENGHTIQPGDQFYLDGLKSKDFNGEEVEVIQAATRPGRWEVEVLSSGAVLSVPEEKLFPLTLEEDEQVEDVEEENDEDEDEDEDDHYVDATDATYFQSVEGKVISPGDTMKLRGIKKRAKMNGTVVVVVKMNKKKKEWNVELPDGDIISIPSQNLRHISAID